MFPALTYSDTHNMYVGGLLLFLMEDFWICRYDAFMFPQSLETGTEQLSYRQHYSDVVRAKGDINMVGGKATHASRGSSARAAKAAG